MRSLRSATIAVVVLSFACSPPDSKQSAGRTVPSDCRDSTEAGALRCAGGLVKRDGLELRVELRDGLIVSLRDDTTGSDTYIRLEYLGHLASIGSHLIGVGYYEGGGFLLLNDSTGGRTNLAGPPVISPDGQRFVTASMDMEAEYDPTMIQVWRVSKGQPTIEFSLEPKDWGPSDPVWLNDSTVDFRKNMTADHPGSYRTEPARLTRTSDQWRISDVAP